MSIPTLAKTWQFDVANRINYQGTVALSNATMLLAVKDAMRNLTFAPWTVAGSCDGVTAGMDTVDRWVDTGDIVFAVDAVAHSWIVLKQTGLTSNFQLLLECSLTPTGSESSGRGYVSHTAGFTGGTTTARPTATDEMPIGPSHGATASWGTGTTESLIWNLMQSTDGECTRLISYRAATTGPFAVTYWCFEKMANPIDGWTNPVVSAILPNNNLTFANLQNLGVNSEPLSGRHGTAQMWGAFSVEGFGGGSSLTLPQIASVPNEISGEWAMHPMGFYVPNTTQCKGRHGSFFDLWTASLALQTGTTFPDDDSLQFVKFGNLVFPWDGETPPLVC